MVYVLGSFLNHRLSMFSHKIFAYRKCNGIFQQHTYTHTYVKIYNHTRACVVYMPILELCGTRTISIHLTFNMPIYERNVNCFYTLVSFQHRFRLSNSLAVWPNRFHFVCGSGGGGDGASADFIGTNVWARVRICGLRCFLSSRCYIFIDYISFTQNDFFFLFLSWLVTLFLFNVFFFLLCFDLSCSLLRFCRLAFATEILLRYFLCCSFIMHYRILISPWIRVVISFFFSLVSNAHSQFILRSVVSMSGKVL